MCEKLSANKSTQLVFTQMPLLKQPQETNMFIALFVKVNNYVYYFNFNYLKKR